jgi:hypothetical protein
MSWVRVGLATLIAGSALGGASMAGCSGDDNNGGGNKDSGTADHTNPTDGPSGGDGPTGNETGPTGEGGSDAAKEAGPTVVNAKVFLVHAAASPNTHPLRFCFGLGNATDGGVVTVTGGIDPFPDFKVNPAFPVAGLFPGFGGSTASSPQLKTFDLKTLTISLYAIDAIKIANNVADAGPDGGAEIPCEGLIGSDGLGSTAGTKSGTLTQGTDYWFLGSIPAGTLDHGTTWVAAVTGCAPGEAPTYSAAFCPSPYSATTGNYQLSAFKLDNTTALDGGAMGVQFANASSAWDGIRTLGGGATTAGGVYIQTTTASDAGGDAAPTTTTTFAAVGAADFGKTTALGPVPGVTFDGTSGAFAAFVGADGGTVVYPAPFLDDAGLPHVCTPGVSCVSPFVMPLPLVDQITNGSPEAGTFANGKGFAFILMGDPQQPVYIGADGGASDPTNGAYNGKSVHFLGFPTANP